MLLVILACAAPKITETAPLSTGDTAADTEPTAETDTDTDADTDSDSDTDSDTDSDSDSDSAASALLDACVAGGALTEDWSITLPGVTSAPRRLAWEADALVVLADDGLWAFDLPAPAALGSDVVARWSAAGRFVGLALPAGAVATGDGATLRVYDRVTGAAVATAEASSPITALSADGAGVFGGTTTTPFRWDGAALTHDAALGLSDARAVGRLDGAFWTAADADAPRVGWSDGATTTDTRVPTFGDATEVLPRPGGGAWVLGGPDSYAWMAWFAPDGALDGYSQTFVGISQAAASPASAYAWTAFAGLGMVTFGEDPLSNAMYSDRTADMTGIALDPEGRWLLTAHPDGSLRRWSCAPG